MRQNQFIKLNYYKQFNEDLKNLIKANENDLVLFIKQGFSSEQPIDLTEFFSTFNVKQINQIHIVVDKNSHVLMHDAYFSQSSVKHIYADKQSSIDFYFSINKQDVDQTYYIHPHGAQSIINLKGYYVLDEDNNCSITTYQNHINQNTQSLVLVKGVLQGRSKAIYKGMIDIAYEARGTNAQQTNKHLLLDPHAHAISVPSLEIQNNDVQCSHGSALSYFDKKELFYLQSRGLSAKKAKTLLLDSFLWDVDIHKKKLSLY